MHNSRNKQTELFEKQIVAEEAAIFKERQVEPMYCDGPDDAISPLQIEDQMKWERTLCQSAAFAGLFVQSDL